uniref:Transposase n=1 Tax=Romanomermis culicivorax TaxID=13658 RepID=A0A915IVI3_ROMCU
MLLIDLNCHGHLMPLPNHTVQKILAGTVPHTNRRAEKEVRRNYSLFTFKLSMKSAVLCVQISESIVANYKWLWTPNLETVQRQIINMVV